MGRTRRRPCRRRDAAGTAARTGRRDASRGAGARSQGSAHPRDGNAGRAGGNHFGRGREERPDPFGLVAPAADRSLRISGARVRPRASFQPPHGLFHIGRRTREGKSQIGVPAPGIEIGPRRRGNAGFRQHAPAEFLAVIRQMRDVGVEIERAIGGREAREPGLWQRRQQQIAVRLVARDIAVELHRRIERRQRRDLRQRRRRDVEILRQHLDRAQQIGRHDHPAQAPAGHRIIFGEAVDDDRLVAELQRRRLVHSIRDAVIDFVGDQPHAA